MNFPLYIKIKCIKAFSRKKNLRSYLKIQLEKEFPNIYYELLVLFYIIRYIYVAYKIL